MYAWAYKERISNLHGFAILLSIVFNYCNLIPSKIDVFIETFDV